MGWALWWNSVPHGALVPCHLAHSCFILTGICSGKRAPSSAPCWRNHGVSRVPFQWTFPSPTPGFGACVNYCSLSCERNNLRKKVFIWAHNLRVWFIMVGAMVTGVGHIESITKRERDECWCSSGFLPLPLLFILGPQHIGWSCLHSWRVFSVESSLEAPLNRCFHMFSG